MRSIAAHLLFFALFSALASSSVLAQKAQFKKAEQLFEQMAFHQAIPLYQELSKGPEGLEASLRLAECYRLTNQLGKAENYYARGVDQSNIRPEFVLYYAQALQINGKCSEAVNWYRRYQYLQPGDSRGSELLSSCADISDLIGTGTEYEILPLSLNSARQELSPVIYRNGLVFTSNRPGGKERNRAEDRWTGEPYTKIFFAEGSKDRFAQVRLFHLRFNSALNDGPASFSGTGNTIFFSRNNPRGGKRNRSSQGGRAMQLYQSIYLDGEWSKPERLPFCDSRFDYMHPAVSPDGKSLVFASNRPGGLGGMDLWITERTAEAWSQPVNLSSVINSPGNDVFPFLHDDGTLYFASDGRRGLGGLDIYRSVLKSGRFAKAENMRSPINSPQDDFGLVFDPNRDQGYFSSNRPGGKGGDDLYSMTRFPLFMEGILVEDGTMKPLQDALVMLHRDGNAIQQVRSDSEGRFAVRVSSYENYKLTAFREGYNGIERTFSTGNRNPDRMVLALERLIEAERSLTLDLKVIEKQTKMPLSGAQLYLESLSSGLGRPLETDLNGEVSVLVDKFDNYTISADKISYFSLSERIPAEAMTGKQRLTRILELESYQIGKPIRFRDIVYEHAQTALTLEAKLELDQLARLMLTNPSMVVEIGSHTDANGRNTTNDRVSTARAEEAVLYLEAQGVERKRLVAVGYGETQLLNHCADHVQCPEELHRENRRTEWKILQY